MNARKARERHAAERDRLADDLASMRDATPRLVGSLAGQDHYLVGRVLVVIPALRDDYPAPVKDAIDRRRRAALTGRCDCGATYTITRRGHLALEHEHACPAADDHITAIAADHGVVLRTH